ncbi:very short patch repair endonuclease [Nocardioides sp. MAHUQ-72]|uniref:very short patch repair endonuclease n=1 Tax=unclassified Nocardioides TaxID=2615069 RepID=UPI003621AF46
MLPESWASSPATRRTMLGNRRTGTKPEVALRSALHAAGLRFRKDYRLDLGTTKVRPDIVFTRAKVAVFVDGCFWHSCPTHGTQPKRNTDYWGPKLARNVARDREHDSALTGHGWTVVRIWEHEPLEEALRRVVEARALPPADRNG